ncbi:ABC transporter ATP-binding protein [Maricaulis sp.]|jgi:lipoprotein-releasing system ATP-binding protein|uniref:ABC transporter ATP-binding protein n=1 Tax=Maricaulis sp. TaxID=1486257 RepID=UPI0025CFE223|nr:ABC transporter ATP-binding protein [Maricaulis sp.]MDF1767265.1 ABC transporter ATP-binding protein [Maricaulis sp.]
MSDFVLELDAIDRTYVTEAGELPVLQGASLALSPGEIVGLVGPSGSGKSSLLHAAGLLERPDAGEVRVRGTATIGLSDRERTAIRRREIGFVYQFHHLLPEFDALENIVLPQLIGGVPSAKARERAEMLLTQLGLADRLLHQPSQLSGGEQQRVAIARALANSPHVLLADEPTGNLDPATSETVFDAFRETVRAEGAAALVATHNHELAGRMDRILTFADGRLTPYEPA